MNIKSSNIINKIKLLNLLDKKYKFIKFLILFILFSSYLFGFTRNKFETISEVVIRSSGNNSLNLDIQSIFSSASGSQVEDGKFLEIYLNSLDSMIKYDEIYSLSENYKKKGLDIFNGLEQNPTKEDKLRFYKSMININLDSDYGVLEIRTYGYTPNQSLILNNFLINRSRSFINKINKDINKEQLKFSTKEGMFAKERVNDASKKLQEYQDNNKLINIQSEIQTSTSILSNLESQLVSKKVELSNNLTKYANQEAPEIYYLVEQIKELEKIIQTERENIVSPEGRELNKKAVKFDELIAELDFAMELYKTILTSVESSRINSIKDQRFITILSEPFLPEEIYMKWKYLNLISFILITIITFSLMKFILLIINNRSDNE